MNCTQTETKSAQSNKIPYLTGTNSVTPVGPVEFQI